MKNCPCNIQRILSETKIENFIGIILICLILSLKRLIKGIRGLGFKFVDFLCKRSDVCHTEIKML